MSMSCTLFSDHPLRCSLSFGERSSLGARRTQGFVRCLIKKGGGTLVLGPCIGPDLVRSTLVLGAEPEGVKVSAPRNLDFPL